MKTRPVKRLTALALCLVFIAVSLLAAVFVYTHLNHTHDHNGPEGSCATCAHIAVAENLRRQLGTGAVAVVLAFGMLFALLAVLKPVVFGGSRCTLVSAKIRLNR
jgi:hypothetical protein